MEPTAKRGANKMKHNIKSRSESENRQKNIRRSSVRILFPCPRWRVAASTLVALVWVGGVQSQNMVNNYKCQFRVDQSSAGLACGRCATRFLFQMTLGELVLGVK